MNRKGCLEFVRAIESVDTLKMLLRVEIDSAPEKVAKPNTWQYHAKRLLDWLESGMEGKPPFSVLKKGGNSKLPFYAFSSLAMADCPGMGACGKYCYSLKGWRYPAAFFRQVQNSLLMRFRPEVIESHWNALPQSVTVRLFVDGDFPSVGVLRFFMDLCKARPDLSVYGYSKSWKEFVSLDASGYAWPENYLVNQSNGSRWHGTGIGNAFKALPIVRGEFDAVEVDKAHIRSKAYQDKANAGSNAYRKAVRVKLKALHEKVFACPGNCGNCLPAGRHACGSKEFSGIAIGIGIHA